MPLRVSNGLHLEVLRDLPAVGVPLEFDVYDGADPGTMLATLENATGKGFTVQLMDLGSGKFELNRWDAKASAVILRKGNLVKCRVGGYYRAGFYMDDIKLKPVAAGERGAQLYTVSGRGLIAYLERAAVYPPGWPVVSASEYTYTAVPLAAILHDQLTRAQLRGALPDLSWNFDGTADSQGNPWTDTVTMTVRPGTSLLDLWTQLVGLGLESEMTPELQLRAYVELGVHREATVMFREAYHLTADVTKTLRGSPERSRLLVEGADGKWVEVVDPAAEADPYTGRREGYVSFTSSGDPTTLQRAGERSLRQLQADTDALTLPVRHSFTEPGQYEPWVHYRHGDWTALHVPGAYDRAAHRVVAMTLEEVDGGDYGLTLDLNSVALEALLRMKRAMDAIGGGSSGTATSGSVGNIGSGGGGGGSSSSAGRVQAETGDSSGYLYDKLATGAGLSKSLIGAAGARQVRLAWAAGLTDLDDVDVISTPPEDAQALVYDLDLGLWVPGDVAAGGGAGAAPVTDFTAATGAVTLAASGVIATRTVTLPAGTYVALGRVRVWSGTSMGNPGSAYLRAAGVQVGVYTDLRNSTGLDRVLFGSFVHAGGPVTVDLYFDREAGSVTFGNGEARFGQSIHVAQLGGGAPGAGVPSVVRGLPTGALARSYDFATTTEGWTADVGTLSAVGGKLRLASTTANCTALEPSGAANIADGELEVDSTVVAGLGVGLGLVFRATDANNHYLVSIHSNPSGGDPRIALYKKVAGTYTLLNTIVAGENSPIGAANGGEARWLARFYGSRIEVYMNGTLLLATADTTFTTGRVGIRGSSSSTVDWDRVRVYNGVDLASGNLVATSTATGGIEKVYTRRDSAATVVNPEPTSYVVVPNIAAVSVVLAAVRTIRVRYSGRIAKGNDGHKVRFVPHRDGAAMGSDRYSQSVGESNQQDVSGEWLARDLPAGTYSIDMRHTAALGTASTTFYEQVLSIEVLTEAT